MTVTLNQPRVHPSDTTWSIVGVGIDYVRQRVVVRIGFQNGDIIGVQFEKAALTSLRNSVSQFSGLRAALEQYIAANRPDLAGTPT